MPTTAICRALIAVYDKTGITEFARALVDEFGIEIISTGGTAKHLKDAGIPVTMVETVTGFPEMLDGRVKTLHPNIHAGILADRDNPEHMRQLAEHGIQPIDMVVVNLYPFEKTIADPNCKFEDAIEMIDIGGPCLLRAAAKNHRHVFVFSMKRYDFVLETLRGDVGADTRDRMMVGAIEAFLDVTRYDIAISSWISSPDVQNEMLQHRFLEFSNWGPLRYGENPHQECKLLDNDDEAGFMSLTIADSADICQDKMSCNNYLDADSALKLCAELSRASVPQGDTSNICVFIKHTNACGVGVSDDPLDAYRRAYVGDPNAAMGGILAVNFPVTKDFAEVVMETYDRFGKAAGAGGFFVEVWVAPWFEEDAVEVIRAKKKWGTNVRLLAVGDISEEPDAKALEYKTITGGMLVQSPDLLGLNENQWKVVTKRQPTESEISDLRLAWLIAKHTKSNAISICKDGMLIGNGAGQMSRVMSCRIATWLAKENGHAEKLAGSVAASDAFFPFRDGPGILIDAGITALIQPGGSKRDEETIALCDERGVAMIFTGTRHFKH